MSASNNPRINSKHTAAKAIINNLWFELCELRLVEHRIQSLRADKNRYLAKSTEEQITIANKRLKELTKKINQSILKLRSSGMNDDDILAVIKFYKTNEDPADNRFNIECLRKIMKDNLLVIEQLSPILKFLLDIITRDNNYKRIDFTNQHDLDPNIKRLCDLNPEMTTFVVYIIAMIKKLSDHGFGQDTIASYLNIHHEKRFSKSFEKQRSTTIALFNDIFANMQTIAKKIDINKTNKFALHKYLKTDIDAFDKDCIAVVTSIGEPNWQVLITDLAGSINKTLENYQKSGRRNQFFNFFASCFGIAPQHKQIATQFHHKIQNIFHSNEIPAVKYAKLVKALNKNILILKEKNSVRLLHELTELKNKIPSDFASLAGIIKDEEESRIVLKAPKTR